MAVSDQKASRPQEEKCNGGFLYALLFLFISLT